MRTHRTAAAQNRIALAALALSTALSLFAAPSQALAGPLPNLSGWGVRDYGSFMGSLTLQTDGTITGHFTIIIAKPGEDPVYCRYLRFRPNERGSLFNVNAYGTCYSSSGSFAAENRLAMGDYGSPGVGVDYIDVNYYGATGVSIPGGFFDDGDIIYTP